MGIDSFWLLESHTGRSKDCLPCAFRQIFITW